MAMVINTNVMAINAQRNLGVTNIKLGRALEKLSSGLRINRAADDAAGLAISEKMRSLIRGMRQGARNGQDGISMIQTAEGALSAVHDILQRMRELTVQAGNSTLSADDRTALGEEIVTLNSEITNIADRTTFNGLSLLTGSLSTAVDQAHASNDVDVGDTLDGLTVYEIDMTGARASVSPTEDTYSYEFTYDANSNVLSLTEYVDSDGSGAGAPVATGRVATVGLTDAAVSAQGVQTLNFASLGIKLTFVGQGTNADTFGAAVGGNGVVTAVGSGSATYRVGAMPTDNIAVTFNDLRASALGTGAGAFLSDLVTTSADTVKDVGTSNTLLQALDDAIVQVSSQRAKLGAAQNQIEAAVNSLGVVVENLTASESRIRDADIAEVSSELVARQIMQQAGVAVLAQANASSQAVLALLQG